MIGRQSCLGEQLGVIRGGLGFQAFLAIRLRESLSPQTTHGAFHWMVGRGRGCRYGYQSEHVTHSLRVTVSAILGSYSFESTEIPYLPVRAHPWRLTDTLNSQSLRSCFQFEKAGTPPFPQWIWSPCAAKLLIPPQLLLGKNAEEIFTRGKRTKGVVQVGIEKTIIF